MSGFIKLHRGWRDTDGIAPSPVFSEAEAWLWLLENCAWRALSRFNAKGEEIRLLPGQIHVSDRSLAKAWGWSKGKIRRFLKRLETVEKCTQSADQSGNVLTIVNWEKYQSREPVADPAGEPDADRSRTTQEEGKERKEEKKDNDYAFFGKVIRLTPGDLEKWKRAYSKVDVPALLQSRDDWLATEAEPALRKSWFVSTSNWLAKKQQEAFAGDREAGNEFASV